MVTLVFQLRVLAIMTLPIVKYLKKLLSLFSGEPTSDLFRGPSESFNEFVKTFDRSVFYLFKLHFISAIKMNPFW